MRPRLLLIPFALALLAAPATFAHEPLGSPKLHCETGPADLAVHEYGPSGGLFIGPLFDGASGDCGAGPLAGDGHYEHALGGTELFYWGDTVSDGGSWWCRGVLPDHQGMTTVTVVDESGEPVPFLVGAEQSSIYDFCGDYQDDAYQECLGSCVVTVGHSMDGAYRIYLLGGMRGHIVTG